MSRGPPDRSQGPVPGRICPSAASLVLLVPGPTPENSFSCLDCDMAATAHPHATVTEEAADSRRRRRRRHPAGQEQERTRWLKSRSHTGLHVPRFCDAASVCFGFHSWSEGAVDMWENTVKSRCSLGRKACVDGRGTKGSKTRQKSPKFSNPENRVCLFFEFVHKLVAVAEGFRQQGNRLIPH